jgi:hypothetical protein
VDAWYVWVGLAATTAALLGAAVGLPTAAPPDPGPVARTVDAVAAGPHPATAEHPLDAASIRVGPTGIGLRTDGGAARESFGYGPVTPVGPDGDRLRAVLTGAPPARAFERPAAFATRARRARRAAPVWRPAPEELLVRRVTWEGIDVTLVG